MPAVVEKVAALEHSVSIQQITRDRIDQAYPLARLARPSLSLDRWRRLCAGADDDPSATMVPRGALLLLDRAGWIRGLCSYRVESGAARIPRLSVDIFALAALFGREELCGRMMEALQRIAMAHGCQAIDMQELDARECRLWHPKGAFIPICSVRQEP